jgi:hypothetical protein
VKGSEGMRIEIEIPKEFEEHFKQDRFEESLQRLRTNSLAGRYEEETLEMLIEAFENIINKKWIRQKEIQTFSQETYLMKITTESMQ